ncbi:MAG: SUMF1/EgtB/PvdO family nonheme iron enzyme [Spirochaetaceae bacterium]|nr:SUMF1/EgtB/PvdO family nonheme iron enzyme [Spirochaetaceae bacterium]
MGASSGTNRVKRGGSWNNDARNVRSANRNNNTPSNRNNNLGFRLVRPQPGGESFTVKPDGSRRDPEHPVFLASRGTALLSPKT